METKRRQILLYLSCLLTGFPFSLLADHSFASKKKVINFAMAMLLAMTLNTISAIAFFSQVMRWNDGEVAMGAAWICLITYWYERLIIQMDNNWGTTVVRVLVTFFAAIIFSIGVDLGLSSDDVTRQIEKTRAREGALIQIELDSAYSDQRRLIEERVAKKHGLYMMYDSLSTLEVMGKGSPLRGVGVIYKEFNAKAKFAFADWQKEEKSLFDFDSTLTVKKQAGLKEYQEQPAGPWERVTALHELVLKDTLVFAIYLVFFLLFLCFDFTVLTIKKFSKVTAYEKEQAVIDQMRQDDADQYRK